MYVTYALKKVTRDAQGHLTVQWWGLPTGVPYPHYIDPRTLGWMDKYTPKHSRYWSYRAKDFDDIKKEHGGKIVKIIKYTKAETRARLEAKTIENVLQILYKHPTCPKAAILELCDHLRTLRKTTK